MIDWTEVDKTSPAQWVALSERLSDKAQALLTTDPPVEAALRSAQTDLGDFVAAANMKCPIAAITAVRRTNDQLTRALQAVHLANLDLRNATFDAIKARMSSAANELRADAAKLKLEPARQALALATEAASKIKSLAADVKGMRKDEIPAKIGDLGQRLEEIVALIRGVVG